MLENLYKSMHSHHYYICRDCKIICCHNFERQRQSLIPHGLLMEAIYSASHSGALVYPLLAPEQGLSNRKKKRDDIVFTLLKAALVKDPVVSVNHDTWSPDVALFGLQMYILKMIMQEISKTK
ncbi:uncharacterized protein LOC131646775 [Vicia villosa]|uniref:uncharacterized protein LOC131646775 n=1 Tax=Vicia villosa TaxID=3911 RepID=UPI00273AFC88|nr:uncharacterized protein LOC131646775 [Vicia villosa]XP_058772723.1 uncharacterized protein LOC131646775 [Vicia villosa]